MSIPTPPVFLLDITAPKLPEYFLLFGIVSLVLGLLGYAKAKSKASLIAGTISGVALILAWFLMDRGNPSGKWIALVVSILLTARFLPGFIVRKNFYPSGIMALFGIIGMVLALLVVTK